MKRSSDIYIVGVGNNTPVFIEFAELSGYNVVGLLHFNNSRNGESVSNYCIISGFDDFVTKNDMKGVNFALSMGNINIRNELYRKIVNANGKVPNLIHPTCAVSRFANLADGVIIHASSVVQANSVIMDNKVISFGVCIAHNATIGNSCYLSSGCNIGAYVELKDYCFVGQGAVLVSDKCRYVGEWAVIGASSNVISNVDPNSVVAGNPARVLKKS